MTDKDLLKAIGGIDDRFIDEAAESVSAAPRIRRRRARRAALLAACLAVAVGVTAAVGLPGKNSAAPGKTSSDTAQNAAIPDNRESDAAELSPQDPASEDKNAANAVTPGTMEQYYDLAKTIKALNGRTDSGNADAYISWEDLEKLAVTDPVGTIWYIIKRSIQ